MADAGPGRKCDDACGCVVPCPGDATCRCTTTAAAAAAPAPPGGEGEARHNVCSCGEHCSCNPCTCGRTVPSTGVGRPACTCGPGCTCPACATA